jgi:hypothetical protein
MQRTIVTLLATGLTFAAVFFLGLSGWAIAGGFDRSAVLSPAAVITVSGVLAMLGFALLSVAAFLLHTLTGVSPVGRR